MLTMLKMLVSLLISLCITIYTFLMNTIRTNLTILFFFVCFSQLSRAQNIDWSNISEQYSLPEGVQLFEGTRSSPALKVWYIEVDLKVTEIGLVPYLANNGTETLTEFSERIGAIAAINGGYFGGNNSYSTVVQPGQVLSRNVGSLNRNNRTYPIIRSAFSIAKNRDMSVDWIYHFGSTIDDIYRFNEPMDYKNGASDLPLASPNKNSGEAFDMYMGIGGGPVLVKGDSVHVSYNEEIFWGSGVGLTNRDPRTAVGYTVDGRAILLVTDGRQVASQGLSLPEMAQVMINLGCTEAINLDGGGSSQMAVSNQLINRPGGGTNQRPVTSFLAVVPADSVPGLPVIGFEEILDTADDGVEVSEGWSASANSGYWGESPSLITLGGDGSKTVRFSPELPSAGRYRVDGWWVSSFNRSKKTAHIIQHRLGIDTVYADQSTNSSQWVELGEYEFNGNSEDLVTVSNFGGDSFNYVVADAVRWVGLDEEVTNNEWNLSETVRSFELLQVYPNPFNPSTQIEYVLEQSGSVRLEVFDVQGQLLETLVNSEQQSGTHRIRWQASGQSTGLYFVRIQFENSQSYWYDTHKVTLIK